MGFGSMVALALAAVSARRSPQEDEEVCGRCGARLNTIRLYICANKNCLYPDYPGRE
jgi:hypothetical protein